MSMEAKLCRGCMDPIEAPELRTEDRMVEAWVPEQ
jgi:hypothetical protein